MRTGVQNYIGMKTGVHNYIGMRTGVHNYIGMRTGVQNYIGMRTGVQNYMLLSSVHEFDRYGYMLHALSKNIRPLLSIQYVVCNQLKYGYLRVSR